MALSLCLLVVLVQKRLFHADHVLKVHKLVVENRLPLTDGRALGRGLVQLVIEPRREEFDHELVVVAAIPWRLLAWVGEV